VTVVAPAALVFTGPQTQNGNPVFLMFRSDQTFTGWQLVNDVFVDEPSAAVASFHAG